MKGKFGVNYTFRTFYDVSDGFSCNRQLSGLTGGRANKRYSHYFSFPDFIVLLSFYYGLINTFVGPADNGGPQIYDYTFSVSAYFNTMEFGVRVGDELG